MITCSRLCVQSAGGLFVGENTSLRLSDDARSILDEIVPSQSSFVLETMNRILLHRNVDGAKFDWMPEIHTKARRITRLERSELETSALSRHSLPSTDFSIMLYDVGILYCGIMFKTSGVQAWEDAGVLSVEVLYTDYWRSWSAYADEWDAYEKAGRNITSLPDSVVELIKMGVIFNSCISAVERRSNKSGYLSGIHDVIHTLTYKSFESMGWNFATIYTNGHGLHVEADKLVFAGWLIALVHDVFDYPRDCYEENYGSSCMLLHGLDEDGFTIGCAILFAVWNSLESFNDDTARLFKYSISTGVAGNLSHPRYNGKEQLINCTTSGVWSTKVKASAIDLIKHMTGVSILWPENIALSTISDATYVDYHRTLVAYMYESTAEHVASLCIEWANEIINSTLIRDRSISYVKRENTQCGTWA